MLIPDLARPPLARRVTHEPHHALSSVAANRQSDATLVAAGCAGDMGALEELVRRHYDAAFAVAMAITRETADAEDICHDAFIRAAEQLETCREPSRFRAWLCTIVRNRARNWLTRGVNPAPTLDIGTLGLASENDVARDAELKELRGRLLAAVNSLSASQRDVVLLHDLAGWEHTEIAEFIGTSPGMCRQHLFRARRILRNLLGSTLPEDYLHD